MSHLLNFTKKQIRAEKKMQKLLFGQQLSKFKKCTKKSQRLENKLLKILYSTM